MSLTEIEKIFSPKGVVFGNELLLRRNDAISLLKQCGEMGYRVLGINYFKEDADGDIVEILGAGADFSSIVGIEPKRTIQEGISLLSGNELSDIDWFSFVISRSMV